LQREPGHGAGAQGRARAGRGPGGRWL